jgi:hypothetical protein
MTVYHDAVKLETEDCGRCRIVGWFRDEVSAIGAATEGALMSSAIVPDLRKLPSLAIYSDYINEWCRREWIDFRRATKVKHHHTGRRVVRVPGTFGKVWI